MKQTAYDCFLCCLFFAGFLLLVAGIVCPSFGFAFSGLAVLILFRELLLTP